jgi:hypothetical protein
MSGPEMSKFVTQWDKKKSQDFSVSTAMSHRLDNEVPGRDKTFLFSRLH